MNIPNFIKKNLFSIAIVIVSMIFLMLGQLKNTYKTLHPNFFERGLIVNGDGFVIGKIALAEQRGLFKHIGAIAQILPDTAEVAMTTEEELRYRKSFYTHYSYDAYYNKTKIKDEQIAYYASKIAIHGFLYSVINKIFKPNPRKFVKFLKFQAAFLLSLTLSLMILWAVKLTNILTGILLLLTMMFSPIITYMGTTLYQVPAVFYLPFLLATYFLHKEYKGKLIFKDKHIIYVGISFFISMCFHTYEFITTLGMATLVPFVFYGCLSINWNEAIIRLCKVGFACLAAIVLNTALLFVQNMQVQEQSFKETKDFFVGRFIYRTIGAMHDLESIEKVQDEQKRVTLKLQRESTIVSIKTLIRQFNNQTLSIFPRVKKKVKGKKNRKKAIRYYQLITAICIAFLLAIFTYLFKKIPDEQYRILKTLIITAPFSFLAPLSWWVLFKPHSYLHKHIVVFIWYLPFLFLAYMLLGSVLNIWARNITRWLKAPTKEKSII